MSTAQLDILTAKDKKVLQDYEKIKQEREDIRQRFVDALDTAKADIVRIAELIDKQEEEVKEAYTMFVLNDITAGAYQELKDELEYNKKLLQMSEDKVKNINGLEIEEVNKHIVPKLDAISLDYRKVQEKNSSHLYKQVMLAKEEYLKVFANVRKQYNAIDVYADFEEDVQVDVGLKRDHYRQLSSDVNRYLKGIQNYGADVTEDEVRYAYNGERLSAFADAVRSFKAE